MLPILFLLVTSGNGQATTLQRFDLARLTANAAQIFVGQCHSTRTEVEDGQIYTHLVFSVEQMVKGEPADEVDEVDLHLMGGEYQGVRQHIVGMPSFEPGETVVLFLTADDELGHPWLVGLGQGKFLVGPGTAEGESRRKVYQSLSSGGMLLSMGPDGVAKPVDAVPEAAGLHLDDFLSLVRDLVNSAGVGDTPDAR